MFKKLKNGENRVKVIFTNKFYNILIILTILSGLQGCTQVQFPSIGEEIKPPPPSKTETTSPDKTLFTTFDLVEASSTGEFIIQRGDKLRVMIWGYPGLEHITEVQPNGSISLPLAGEIFAVGLTLPKLQEKITEHLSPFTKPSDLFLRPGDSLTLSVWQNTDLHHKATVEPAGTITFPLAGTLQAAERPLDEITEEVEAKLRLHIRDAQATLLPEFLNRRTLQDFHVSVLTHELRNRNVALIGAVGLQGIQAFKGGGERELLGA